MNTTNALSSARTFALCGALALGALACGSDDSGGDTLPPIAKKPFTATGQAMDVPGDMTWTYVEFPDTTCRDGTPAGLGISKNAASNKLMIYLEGGGACFDSITCAATPSGTTGVSQLDPRVAKVAGIFNRTQAANPVKDWNFVYVPYCTGDTHGGAKPNGTVTGVTGMQQFTGYTNVTKYLNRIVPTFPGVTDVLLTGISAGGFGAAQNSIQVQGAFPTAKFKIIDDSGPGFSTAVMPSCLQTLWRDTWGLEDSWLKDCGAACPDHTDFVQDFALGISRSDPTQTGGLIEALNDGIISRFFGAGVNNCTGTALFTQVPLDIFSGDLLAFRQLLAKDKIKNFSTYFPQSQQHTWIAADTMYTDSSGGVNLIDWITKIVNDQNPGNAGP